MSKRILVSVLIGSALSLPLTVDAKEPQYVSANTDLLLIQNDKPVGHPTPYTAQNTDGCVITVLKDDWLRGETKQNGKNLIYWTREISFISKGCPAFKTLEEVMARIRSGNIRKMGDFHVTADEGGSGTTVHGCGPNGCWQGPPPPVQPRPLNCHFVNLRMICS